MSGNQDRKFFLQLWRLVTGPAIDVMQLYFEVKILHNTEFEKFLNDPNNMHQLFHQCFPTEPCCKCATSSLASTGKRGCLILQQFEKLYDNSGLPQPNHENVIGPKILQHCLCKYSAKSTVTVDELDITLFYNVVQHCCPSKMSFIWRKNIKDVRNFLAHVANGQVEKASFEDNWKKLNDATLGFAGEISQKCRKMTKEVILEIENSPIEVLKDKLKKSNEDLIKMLDTLNGIKQNTVDECKKTVDLINNKQDENFSKLQSSFSNICKSDEILKETRKNKTEILSEFQEVKQKMNHMDTIKVDNLATIISIAVEKVLEKTKGKTSADDNRKITVATQVDSSSLDEEKTIRNISNALTTKIDKKSCDTEKFDIKNVEHKCIQLELVAFPDVFKNPHNLRKALNSLVHRLVEAGEVDTKIPGNLKINLTVKTPLKREEMAVVYAVFNKNETFEESAGQGIDVKPNLYDGISLKQTLKIDPDSLDKSDLKSEIANINDSTVIRNVKMEITDEDKYEQIFIHVDNLRCLLKLTGLPNDLYPSEHKEQPFTVKGNTLCYVEWTIKCPLKWNVSLIVSSIKDNLSTFHDEFPVDYVYSETNSKLIMHTTPQRCVFRSYSSLEVAVKNFIGKIINVSSIKSTEPDELIASVLILTKPDEEGLKKALTKIKKETIEEDESDYDSRYSAEKNIINEEPEEYAGNSSTTREIEMSEEPEQKKRKTATTSEIENLEDTQTEDAGKSLNHLVVGMKQALQKLGEIPLLDHYIDIYRKYIKNIKSKWFGRTYPGAYNRIHIQPKNEKAMLDNLLKEKKKRTKLIAKLKDVIHNQDEFTTTDENYGTDIRFLDVDQNPATKCNYCHTKDESQVACFCNECNIFICDNCVIEHRMKNKNHSYFYLSKFVGDYKLENLWERQIFKIFDMKCVAADIVAILQYDKLCTYNLAGGLINSFTIRFDQDKSRIACINDCKIAVTVPSNNLIEIVNIRALTQITDLRTPAGTNMSGGITCRMDILYVAFLDAIRLMDLSGQIQRVIDIPSVNILHSVNNDQMLFVYSKNVSDKTMSCLEVTNGNLYNFERFPFHPESVTTDEVGNILFTEDGVIWQANSDGKNIKIIISNYYAFKMLTYKKDSKHLFTYTYEEGCVTVYRKLQ